MKLLLMLMTVLLFSCADPVEPKTDPFDADHSGIVDPKARWEAYGANDYTLSQFVSCFCIYDGTSFATFTSDTLSTVVDSASNRTLMRSEWGDRNIRSIDSLFQMADSAYYTTPPYILRVTYDVRYGFPSEIYVDFKEMVSDDEFHFYSRLKR